MCSLPSWVLRVISCVTHIVLQLEVKHAENGDVMYNAVDDTIVQV